LADTDLSGAITTGQNGIADKQDNRVGVALESLIANWCIISGSHVQRSILSPRVRVHSYAQVYD